MRTKGMKFKFVNGKLIDNMKRNGISVFIEHNRKYNSCGNHGYMQTKGGDTDVLVTLPSGKAYNEVAACHEKDNYNKRIGLHVCLGRILKRMASEGEAQSLAARMLLQLSK